MDFGDYRHSNGKPHFYPPEIQIVDLGKDAAFQSIIIDIVFSTIVIWTPLLSVPEKPEQL
jgi:hypothetical protein